MSAEPKMIVSDEELEKYFQLYTRDITAIEKTGKFDPVTNRDDEIDHMTLILLQRLRKNVALIGNAGTGKTALFVGLAQWINAGKVPDALKGARLIELEMSRISGGSQMRSDLEGRLMTLVKGVAERNSTRTRPPIIFCIDELHQLMMSFKASSFSGIIDIMKPYLTQGDLYVVGATTHEEYQDYVLTDPAIERRFQKVDVSVPDMEMTFRILMNIKGNFEKHYGITIPREACSRIVKLTDRFIPHRNNPDKSITVMDLACAYAVKAGVKTELNEDAIKSAVAAEAGTVAEAIG